MHAICFGGNTAPFGVYLGGTLKGPSQWSSCQGPLARMRWGFSFMGSLEGPPYRAALIGVHTDPVPASFIPILSLSKGVGWS